MFPAYTVYHAREHPMKDQSKTNQELLKENALLKQRIQELEQSAAGRKQAKEEMRESEERYRTLVENASDIVFKMVSNVD